MRVSEAQQNLQALVVQRSKAVELRDGPEYQKIHQQVLLAERALGKITGTEYAEPLTNSGWRLSHPTPLVFSDSHAVSVICPVASEDRPLLCRTIRFGHVLGHRAVVIDYIPESLPLYGHGLESSKAHRVVNSTWLQELKSGGKDDYWDDFTHFALCFKDCFVELVAKSIEWKPKQKSVEACIEEGFRQSIARKSIRGINL